MLFFFTILLGRSCEKTEKTENFVLQSCGQVLDVPDLLSERREIFQGVYRCANKWMRFAVYK